MARSGRIRGAGSRQRPTRNRATSTAEVPRDRPVPGESAEPQLHAARRSGRGERPGDSGHRTAGRIRTGPTRKSSWHGKGLSLRIISIIAWVAAPSDETRLAPNEAVDQSAATDQPDEKHSTQQQRLDAGAANRGEVSRQAQGAHGHRE